MDEWVTTKQASEVKKVGLTAHRIAELARHKDIVADKVGEKKLLVKVTFKDDKWNLVPVDKSKQKPTEQKPYEEIPQQYRKHFDELAEAAQALHEAQQFILSYDETPEVRELEPLSGIYRYGQCPSRKPLLPNELRFVDLQDNTVCVDNTYAALFFEHFRQEFAELGLNDWRELLTHKMPQKVIDQLRRWANTSRFTYCATCEVCRDLFE